MALPASAPISLSQVATEFGGSLPHNLSEYYRGGTYVPNISANSAVATSGSISLSQFYNTRKLATLFSGSRDTDTQISGGDDYRYFKTPAIVDSNGYTWTFRQWTQGTNANKTSIEVNANVADAYWYSIAWGPGWSTLMQSARESFTAWDGAKTSWLHGTKVIPDAYSTLEETLVITQ